MKQYRFAIVGCGKIAPRHAEQILKHGVLVAVCDVDAEKAHAFASKWGGEPFSGIDELLAGEPEIDVVVICTPNGLHAEHAIKSAQAGKHVLCEKPMCLTVAAAWSMRDTAWFFRRKLFVVKSSRYNPLLCALQDAIVTGRLGKLYSFQLNCFWNRPDSYYQGSWHGTDFPDGGTLFTQFSHYIDALLWLFGDIQAVCGVRRNLSHQSIISFEDTGIVTVTMNNGLPGGINWSVNSYRKNMEISLTILAENASIRIGGPYLNRLEYYEGEGLDLAGESGDGISNQYENYQGSLSHHDKIYENLIKALEDEQHPFIRADDALKTVAAIEKIYAAVSLS